jgi:hypothetical protein
MGAPLTPLEFRKLALALPDTAEGSHMGHPDFRVGGKIFASLTPREDRGMVKLPRALQLELVKADPDVFEPATGAWGKAGCTMVELAGAKKTVLRKAMTAAWKNVAPKPRT